MIGAGSQFDGALLLTWAFFIFFGGLVYWLRREDKREGYPLVDVTLAGRSVEGSSDVPAPKIYTRLFNEPTQMPHHYGSSAMRAERLHRFPGAPLVPIGDPMLAETGPNAYPLREDEPLLAYGHPQVVPLRAARDWNVVRGDTDPRDLPVYDGRHVLVGRVTELWVDRSVKILRYLEVALTLRHVEDERIMLPIYYADISGRRHWVRVRTMLAQHFARVPRLANPDQITAREEDRINAFFAGSLVFGRGMPGGLPESLTVSERRS